MEMPSDLATHVRFQRTRALLEKWANGDFAPVHLEDEDAFAVPESFKGCAILDSGATSGVPSLVAADHIQESRIQFQEPGNPEVYDSSKKFKFGDGGEDTVRRMIDQPATAGILKGTSIPLHVVDKPGNKTLPLFPISEMRKRQMVVDYAENRVSFKSEPRKWYHLPTTGQHGEGLMMLLLTQEAVETFTPCEDSE